MDIYSAINILSNFKKHRQFILQEAFDKVIEEKTKQEFETYKDLIVRHKLDTNIRTEDVSLKRFFLVNEIRKNTDLILEDIGKMFNKHHSSIIHSLKRHREMMLPPNKLYYFKATKELQEELAIIYEGL